jgi:hypothetical protein
VVVQAPSFLVRTVEYSFAMFTLTLRFARIDVHVYICARSNQVSELSTVMQSVAESVEVMKAQSYEICAKLDAIEDKTTVMTKVSQMISKSIHEACMWHYDA